MPTIKLTLAEQALQGREFTTGLSQFPVYCYKCHTIMDTGTLVKRYDAATLTHETCPVVPLKNMAIHRYGS